MSRFWLNKGYDAKMTVSGSTVAQQESVVLAETFERHWDQLKGITNNVRNHTFHLTGLDIILSLSDTYLRGLVKFGKIEEHIALSLYYSP